jgi:hypothetical protein
VEMGVRSAASPLAEGDRKLYRIYIRRQRRAEGGRTGGAGVARWGGRCIIAAHGATEEQVLRAATTHLAEVHHIKELTPGLAAMVLRNIRTE